MSLEDVKQVCEVMNTSSINARFEDITMHAQQPRFFTFNGSSLNAWHADLPMYIFERTDQQRMAFNMDVKSVLKRCAFAHVAHNMISDEIRAAPYA